MVDEMLATPRFGRPRRLGGDGTPMVGEFAPAELGAVQGMHPAAASALVADALDLRHRMPRLWTRVQQLELRVWVARKIAGKTRQLTLDQARRVDAQVTAYTGTLPAGRLLDLVDAKVIAADPEAAQARAEAAAAARFVRTGESTEHGLTTIIARVTAGDAIWLVAACDRIARILGDRGDTDPLDARRSSALGILADPARALRLLQEHQTRSRRPDRQPEPDSAGTLPPATLYLHLSQETFTAALAGRSTGAARMEQVGPITVDQVRGFLRHCQVTVQPVVDLNRQTAVDAYEIPDRIREHVHLRTPVDVFPHASVRSRHVDLDHTVPYEPNGPPGQTSTANLGPLNRHHHRIKTHCPGWSLRQPEPGTYLWRTPHGHHFQVDHAGTHHLDPATGRLRWQNATAPRSRLEAAVEELVLAA